MILSAFEVKFHEKKDEMPSRARRPSKSEETKQCAGYGCKKVKKKNNVDKEGPPPARPPERGVWGAQPVGKRKKGVYFNIYIYL